MPMRMAEMQIISGVETAGRCLISRDDEDRNGNVNKTTGFSSSHLLK